MLCLAHQLSEPGLYFAMSGKMSALTPLSTNIVILNMFYESNHCYREWNMPLNMKICKYLVLN